MTFEASSIYLESIIERIILPPFPLILKAFGPIISLLALKLSFASNIIWFLPNKRQFLNPCVTLGIWSLFHCISFYHRVKISFEISCKQNDLLPPFLRAITALYNRAPELTNMLLQEMLRQFAHYCFLSKSFFCSFSNRAKIAY